MVKKPSTKEVGTMMSTESYVRQYFADIPIMIHIAECESTFRQLDKDGEIHRSYTNDVGVMQINEDAHLETSTKEDYDIYTIQGNTAYARELYEKKGTQPWNSSKKCWNKYVGTDSVDVKI